MNRNLNALESEEFDVLVIGGGAFGAAAAWDATLRGLKVVLVEQSDFGSGASAECIKMVHGGIRYLQHGDIKRLRSSCAERSALLRIAPHLVSPLSIVIPTYGHGRKGKAFLGAGMFAYDLLTVGRNSEIRDPTRHIRPTRFLTRGAILDVFPELDPQALSGGAIFDDGQMYNAAGLVLAFIKSAVAAGAVAANYVEASRFLWDGKRVRGVRAYDRLGGNDFDIRARLVLNAAGPWAEYLLRDTDKFGPHIRGAFSRDACFVVNRKPRSPYALAVPGKSRDRDAIISRAARHLFTVPWRDYTMIGVWHKLFDQRPDCAIVEEPEILAWMSEINQSYPALRLTRDEVIYASCGLVPFGDGSTAENDLSFGKESRFIDHRRTHGIDGLVTLIGIRYTTARGHSAKALDLLLEQWPTALPRAATERTPLAGGDIAEFDDFRSKAMRERPPSISQRTLEALLRNHGTEYRSVIELAGTPGESEMLSGSETLVAEVTHAVRENMAVHLDDVVLRRTNLGSGSHPGVAAIEQAADRMQELLGWSEQRRHEEVAATERTLRRHLAGSASLTA
jgi:glycerol-3-phosphate dehydrogenase